MGYSVFADEEEDERVFDNIKVPNKNRNSSVTYYDVRHDVGYPSEESHEASEIFVHQMI